jgi:hypothetical protein
MGDMVRLTLFRKSEITSGMNDPVGRAFALYLEFSQITTRVSKTVYVFLSFII